MHEKLELKRSNLRPVNYKAQGDTNAAVASDSRTVSGYAAIFGNRDSAGDVILKGAFSKSISERGPQAATNRKIAFLWQHEMDEPLGRITVLQEDEKGLYFEAILDKIPEADRTLEQLESGTLNQFSIGFQYVWDKMEYDETTESFIIPEVKLFEISVVTLACNELTGYEGLKADQIESEQNKLRRDTEKALKQLSQEQEYLFRQLITKHLALNSAEPIMSLKEQVKPQQQVKTVDISHIKFA